MAPQGASGPILGSPPARPFGSIDTTVRDETTAGYMPPRTASHSVAIRAAPMPSIHAGSGTRYG